MSFEDQIRIALDGAAASLRQHLEADLKAFAQEIARAASEDRQRAVEGAAAATRTQAEAQITQYREAAQKHTEHLKHVAEAQISELRKALEEMRAQAQQQLDAARRIAQAEVEKARAEIERARGELDRGRGEVERARKESAAARAEADDARADSERAADDATQAQQNAERAGGDAATARAEADSARAEAAAARSETRQARLEAEGEVERANAAIEQMKKTSASEAEEIVIARLAAADAVSDRKTIDAVDCARTDSHQLELARAARTADAIRNLDEARGLSEVLERLAICAGNEVDRAAVLLVKGERLTGWRFVGFGANAPAAKSIDLSLDDAGIAGAVVASGTSVLARGGRH